MSCLSVILLCATLSASARGVSAELNQSSLVQQLQTASMTEMSQEQLTQKTAEVIQDIVATAVQALRERGFTAQAQSTETEFQAFQTLGTQMVIMDLGDHAPLNQWLADEYLKWENFLGDGLLHALHIDDVRTINYAVPVVFDPIQGRQVGDSIDEAEYLRHFAPFTGVIAYWTTFVSCEVAAAHVGQVAFLKGFCTLIGEGCRHGMEHVIAPPWGARVYYQMKQRAKGAM